MVLDDELYAYIRIMKKDPEGLSPNGVLTAYNGVTWVQIPVLPWGLPIW